MAGKRKTDQKVNLRNRRRARVRSRIVGGPERPRLNVFRSLKGMYVQLIDDTSGKTMLGLHSKTGLDSSTDAGERKGQTALAYRLGFSLAKKAQTLGISCAVFDRAGYLYHGRVKAVAEGARDGGLTL
ncbi:MAG: 50S ribosomal protein L18 [Candidatus Magasanikbacteria bacterium]|nr:50S ribosomal protein L18 [Candidatus Magasanikbacteria bacterium]